LNMASASTDEGSKASSPRVAFVCVGMAGKLQS